MNLQPTIFSATLLFSGISAALMALLIFYRLRGGCKGFVWILINIAVWTLFYGLELASFSLESMLFWINFEYIGIAFLPAFWLFFVIRFTGREKWLSVKNISLILLIPVFTLLIVWTNPRHYWYYAQVAVDTSGPFPLLAITPGFWYWIFTAYFYSLLALGSLLMLVTFRKASALYQKHNIIILIGVFIPWTANLLYLLHVRPFGHIDITPYAFIFTSSVISFGLLRFKLLDIIPVAREKVIEAMREGVLVLDTNGRMVDCNMQLRQLLDLKTDQMEGMHLTQILPQAENLHRLIHEKNNQTIEIELNFTKSGDKTEVCHLEIECSVLLEYGTIYTGLLLLFRDITPRKQAEYRANAALQLLTGVLDSSLSSVMAFRSLRDEKNTIIDFECIACNRRAMRVLLHGNENLIGKRMLHLGPFIKENGFFEAYVQVVETGYILEREVKFPHNGNVLWLQISAVKLEDGITITFTNISERKKAEQLLQKNEANLSALIENTSDMIWSIDRSYRFMTINSAFKRVYRSAGVQSPQVGDVLDLHIFHSQQAPLWQYFYDRAWQGEAFMVETLIKVADTLQTFECSLNPIRNQQEEVEGITVFSRNITQRKEAENEIQQARTVAENANQFKTRFLANITHEIRTPINAILGFTEILQKQNMNNEHQEYLDYILSASDTLLKLIGDVLDLTKIEQGKMILEQEDFHLQEVINAAIDPYKFRAQEKGLIFQVHFDPLLPAYFQGDSGKVCQVVINLIGNALKFTKDGGIRVDFGQMQDGLRNQEQIHLKVTVSDSGIGIAKEQQELIFQRFTQADASINRKYGGSGLGLSIIKEMIQLMGGALGVISPAMYSYIQGGPGSTFWFTLPLKVSLQQGAILPEVQYEKINYGGKLQVLMAEDNIVNQRLAKLILQEAGCQVTIAVNGQEALSLLQSHPFDIVFMDLQMPVMDGYTATQHIRKFAKNIPVIGLSANVYKEDIDQCYQVGMNDYLSKPYSAEKLIQKLQKWANPLIPSETTSFLSPLLPESKGSQIDLKNMEELTSGNWSEMKEMIEAVLVVEKEFIAAVHEWLLHGNKKALAASAHKLKPCLYLIGLDKFRETLEKLEIQSKTEENAENISRLCIELKDIFTAAEIQLENHLLQYSNE